MDGFDTSFGISFLKHKKLVTPVRVFLSAVIGVQFFGIYSLPPHVLYPCAVLAIGNLLSIIVEKSKLSTVEVAEEKCPKCEMPMYSKMIKCEKCGIQLDTDDRK